MARGQAFALPQGQRFALTRGKGKRADYILYYKPNIPIPIVEAKDNLHPMGAGLQQGLDYSATLGIPFVFASNGDGFVFHDKTVKEGEGDIEKTLALDEFPSPTQLWEKYRAFKGLDPEEERIALQDYHPDGAGKEPRYYQQSAINATVEAIAKGQDRFQIYLSVYQAIGVDIEGYRPTPGAVIPDHRGRHCEGRIVPALA